MGMQFKVLKYLKLYRSYALLGWAKFHMKYEYTVVALEFVVL